MPIFLSREQIYRMLERELPEGVYADGPPSAFYTTADMDSVAKPIATAYGNLERLYENAFPQTADERLIDWEIKVFGFPGDASLSLSERQARVVAKIRLRRGIAMWDLLTLVAGYLPEGKFVQIVEWCHGDGGAWILNVSRLGVNTALGFGNVDKFGNENLCETVRGNGWRLSRSRLGVDTRLSGDHSWQEISGVQARAYTYEIRIFDYEVTGQELVDMTSDLNKAEPARSGRILKQNQDLNDYGLIFPVTDVNRFSKVNCIARDSGSTTGFSGRKHVE